MNVFYTDVNPNVKAALTNRKNYYGGLYRNTDAHAWLNRKMAYVEAFASNTAAGRKASLTVRTQGGIGDEGSNSLYTTNTGGYGQYVPKPHIVSVKISNEGDFGSLKKCEVVFAVYNIKDLNSVQAFFDIGGDLSLSYGWTASGKASGPAGNFSGKIYNFTYNVNRNGGFDCITYGIGEGINILASSIKASIDSVYSTAAATDDAAILDVNLISHIRNLIDQTKVTTNTIVNGIGAVNFPNNWGATETSGTPAQYPVEYYISLEKLAEIINNVILTRSNLSDKFRSQNSAVIFQNLILGKQLSDSINQSADHQPGPVSNVDSESLKKVDKLSRIKLVSNSDITRGVLPSNTSHLISANPMQIIFPGYSDYGTESTNFFAHTDAAESFKKGDLSKTMINVNWLENIFYNQGIETQDHQKSADQTISKFFKNIFDSVLNNSGTRFKLSLISNPQNENQILIADVNYIEGAVEAYELTAVNSNSICRNVSLTSKIPPEFAAAAFVSSANTLMSQKGDLTPLTGRSGTQTIDVSKLNNDLLKTKSLLNGQGIRPSTVSALQSILRSIYQYVTGVSSYQLSLGQAPKEAIPFPLNFSAVLDGIDGFVFGNVVTSNYLPEVYRQSKVAFTVTKVEHLIANNDWTTTISTVCRLIQSTKDNTSTSTNSEIIQPDIDTNTGPYNRIVTIQ